MTRRKFLAGCSACAAAGGLAPLSGLARAAQGAGPAARPAGAGKEAKARVRLVFTHVPSTGPTWPNIGYDFEKRKRELIDKLTAGCPQVEFLPVTVMNRAQAGKVVAADKDIDAYLVYMLGIWTGAPGPFAASGRPTLFVDDLYGGSGEFLIANAAARRARRKVACVSSSRLEDVVEAARCFALLKQGKSAEEFLAACNAARVKSTKPPGDMACKADPVKPIDVSQCLKKLRGMTILTVGGGWGMPGSGKAIEALLGTKVVPVGFKELHAAYERADKDQAAKWADVWIKAAQKVVEPSRQEIVKSGAMYLGMKELLRRRNAQAITINCLGGYYGGRLKAYPCLGFTQLNNDGLVGACESDIRSTITMLAIGTLSGRPGYISDPVIDTAKRQVIYAHCVAPTKVFGPAGGSNPYHIRSHSEDRRGAAMRSLLPLGYLTTTLELHAGRKQFILHQGKSMENIDEDKACRTKLAVEVKGDIEKLFNYWDQWGWHRVTFYGDLKPCVQEFAKALKIRVIEEA